MISYIKDVLKRDVHLLQCPICGATFSFDSTQLKYTNHHAFEKEFIPIGIDISKEGIQLASKNDRETTWLTGNIGNMPITDNSVDIVLNTLSPANYSEFSRILKPDGLLIKTVPGKDYLSELRKTHPKKEYDNAGVRKRFKQNYYLIRELKVYEKKKIQKSDMINVLGMPPLSWGLDFSSTKFLPIPEITFDLHVLTGNRNKFHR